MQHCAGIDNVRGLARDTAAEDTSLSSRSVLSRLRRESRTTLNLHYFLHLYAKGRACLSNIYIRPAICTAVRGTCPNRLPFPARNPPSRACHSRKEFSNAGHRLSSDRRPLSRSVRALRARLRSFVRSRRHDPRLRTGRDRLDRLARLSRLRLDPPRTFLTADVPRMTLP
jgi:hypothetical protein